MYVIFFWFNYRFKWNNSFFLSVLQMLWDWNSHAFRCSSGLPLSWLCDMRLDVLDASGISISMFSKVKGKLALQTMNTTDLSKSLLQVQLLESDLCFHSLFISSWFIMMMSCRTMRGNVSCLVYWKRAWILNEDTFHTDTHTHKQKDMSK